MYELREAKRILVKFNLTNLYSELNYLQRKRLNYYLKKRITKKITLLNKANKLMRLEIQRLKARAQYLKSF